MSKQKVAEDQRRGIRPNTFPTPNEHVDYAMEMLTSDEYKVLNFAIRHTWGWHVDQKAMALTMFTHGYGPYSGVGLSRATVIKCLGELSKYKFLIPIGKANSDGQVWSVGLDPDLDGLHARFEEKKQQREGMMAPLRAKKKEKSKTAVYMIDRSMTKTGSGLRHRPLPVYDKDASKDTSIDTIKDKKETTFAASHDAAPVTDDSLASSSVLEGKEMSAQVEHLTPRTKKAKGGTTTPSPDCAEPPPPKAPTPAAQLGDAFGIPPIGKRAWSKYGEVAKVLIDATITPDDFKRYIDWTHRESKQTGDWTVTITALMNPERLSKYVQARNAHASISGVLTGSQVYSSVSPSRRAYNRYSDPSYTPNPIEGTQAK